MVAKLIRIAKTSDSVFIADLIVNAWQNAYVGIIDPDYPKNLSREKYAIMFKNIIEQKREIIFVYEQDNKLVGFISGIIQPFVYDSQVIGLYVSPESQGKGIGRKLLRHMRDYFSSAKCNDMIIWTLLGAKNNKFYKNNGGVEKDKKEIRIGSQTYPGIGYYFNLNIEN